jgi:hypothetical protein
MVERTPLSISAPTPTSKCDDAAGIEPSPRRPKIAAHGRPSGRPANWIPWGARELGLRILVTWPPNDAGELEHPPPQILYL